MKCCICYSYQQKQKNYDENDYFSVPLTNSDAVAWRCSLKNVFLKSSPNSQENTSKETTAQVFSCPHLDV